MQHMQCRLTIYSLVFISLLHGCAATGHRPDLQRLYQQNRDVKQPPVVIIHGLLGGRLSNINSGNEAWFGGLYRLAFSDYAALALEIDPQTLQTRKSELVPTGLADQSAGYDYYISVLNTLETAGGYRKATVGEPQDPDSRNYYVFVYDWRQDNIQSVRELSQFIDQIRTDYNDPALKVDLIAHSMGGLIARYYLRYGVADTLDDNNFDVSLEGAKHVRRIVLLGTPNLGSVSALHAFIKGYKIGLRRLPAWVLATMPSTYQLFPHTLNNWIVTTEGKPLDRDLFDVNIWRRFQWSIFDPEVRAGIIQQMPDTAAGEAYLETLEAFFEKHLERARRFVWSLTVPLPVRPYQLIIFGGDCDLTPARLVVEEVDGISEIRLWPDEISNPVAGVDYDELMLEPGDGTVTKASLLARESLDPSVPRHRYVSFPLGFPMFLCSRHDTLTSNISFQDNLLHTLLSIDPDE